MSKKLLISIPCLNEAENLGLLLKEMPQQINDVSKIDILVISDGSTDDTGKIAKNFKTFLIEFMENKGLSACFQAAVDFAIINQYDYLVTIDGDRQFNPKDIPLLVAPMANDGADFTTASRFIDQKLYPQGIPGIKLIGNLLMSKLISLLTSKKLYDVSCGFRGYSREALLNLNLIGNYTYTQEVILDLSFKLIKIKEVPIQVHYFTDRKSRIASNLFKYAYKTSFIIFRTFRDYSPLKFFWGIAAVLAILALSFAGVSFKQYFETGAFRGKIWVGILGGFMGVVSILLFMTGMMADMLDRSRKNQDKILYLLKSKR